MRKKTLRTRIMCGLLTLVFLASLFQVPLPVEAANTATIPITVGGKTFNVTPGQWVTVNTPGGTTSYNVRFVDGKPVALEMSQYQQIVFGDAATAAGSTSGSAAQSGNTSTGSTSGSAAQSGNTSTGSTSGSAAQTGNTSTGATSGSTAQTSVAEGATTSTGAAQTPSSSGKMTWNEFQKANAGKGMSSSEMSQAWKDYKAGNTGATPSNAAQSGSTSTGATSGNTTQASVAEGTSTPTGSTSTGAAQTGNTSTGATQTNVADGSAAQSGQSNWNPAKHPRDPQTGKFISHEEAIARGLMDPADASTTSSNSSQSTQTAETSQQASQPSETTGSTGSTGSTETAQASTDNAQAPAGDAQASTGDANQSGVNGSDAANSAQAAQAGSEGAASGEKTKTSIGDKFKSGYQTGKNLTKQGFQNVKDSLKSGFSAKNLLVTAGITVGVDLATQVMRGEKPSLKSALKTICSAEFVGSVGGSVLGSAAGSFFVPFLSCIPVVGGALSALAPTFGSVVGSSVGAYVAGDLKNGRFSIKEAFKRIDWVGVTGQTIGSTVGAALGSCLGPVGTVIGGMAGGYLGNWAAHKIAGLFGKGEADLPTISMPTGGTDIVNAGTISLGGDDVTSVTISDSVTPAVVDDDDEESSREYASTDEAITAAYEDYTEYYTEYSKLIQAGKTEEALEVADKMNEAKARYDALRSGE